VEDLLHALVITIQDAPPPPPLLGSVRTSNGDLGSWVQNAIHDGASKRDRELSLAIDRLGPDSICANSSWATRG
jgi:hypothetical protein